MKWRVYSWHEGEAVSIQWDDGSLDECPDHPKAEDWQQIMAIDSSDDCEAAGWKIDEAENVFYDPVNEGNDELPTRWRDAEELPDWWSESD